MIHAIGQDLNAQLAARDCPLRVIDGAEQTKTTTFARERIVIERDEDAGDAFAPIKAATARENPPKRGIRSIGVKLTIYAQAVASGSKPYEHERRIDHLLDVLYCCLFEVAAVRRNGFVVTSAKQVPAEDLKDSEVKGGTVYELRLRWDRGIYDRKWDGTAKPEVTVGGVGGVSVNNTTKVSLPGGTEETAAP